MSKRNLLQVTTIDLDRDARTSFASSVRVHQVGANPSRKIPKAI